MTLQEISQSLPNGFHDAEFHRINIDYGDSRMVLETDVWVGKIEDPVERREAYRLAKLTLNGLYFCSIEAPDPAYLQLERERDCPQVDDFPSLEVTEASLKANWSNPDLKLLLPGKLIESRPENAFVHSFFVFDWNAFIHVAAEEAKLEWLGETEYREG